MTDPTPTVRCRASLTIEDATGEARKFRCRRRRGHPLVPLAGLTEAPGSTLSHMADPFDFETTGPIATLLWLDDPDNRGSVPDDHPVSIIDYGP